MLSSSVSTSVLLPALAFLLKLAAAHDNHGDKIPEGEAISPDPIDGILWWHIFVMILSFGILFPVGMVLGIVRSRWHVPVQVVASVIAFVGWMLGHTHKGRQFAPNIHASFANVVMLILITQIGVGVYLKLHLERGFHGRIRKYFVLLHGICGKAMPVVSWVQMLFGGITALGFCRADHLGQCLAHFIMGSSFIGYGIIMCIMLLVGQGWLRKANRSQEFWDSGVIAAWGCINTFTEHRWGHEWAHNDIQHTSMGVIWWCAGLLGLWLSRGKNGEPKRNIIPGLVILLTGYAMSAHPQHLPLSTMVHTIFGYTLMGAGIARIIEVCFVLNDQPASGEPKAFQHLAPYLLFASGFIFMCATEEQMAMVSTAGIDHVSYLLIIYSVAFLMYLFTQVLLYIFEKNYAPSTTTPILHRESGAIRPVQERHAQDAEEFELGGLLTDEDDDDEPERANKRQ